MQGKNHVALALAVPLGAAMATGRPDLLPATVPAWGGLVLGSLAPDMDGEGSIAYWGNFLPRGITPRPLVALLNGLGRTVSSVIRSIFGHRKALHWPLWGVGLAVAGVVFGFDWLVWLGVGYVLHILGDSLTKSGVPLLGPVLTTDISFTPMVTGKFFESALGVLLWGFVAWRLAVELLPRSSWLWGLLYRFGGQLL
jgi:membrane-bound metal-dependent hydrolase YbcI (DUF457 family)